MSLVNKYRWGNAGAYPASSIEIDSLSTLESIKSRQSWMIGAQLATIATLVHQTDKTNDALQVINDTLNNMDSIIKEGFSSLESSIERLEANLLENLNEIKWYLFNVDQKLDQLINLVKFSGATKSAEFNKQGFILYKMRSYNEAIAQLEKSLQENPLNIEAYINLGFVFLRQDNLEKALHQFERAALLVKEDFSYFKEVSSDKLLSTEIFILDSLSSLYSIQERYQQAVDMVRQILEKDISTDSEVLFKYKLAKYLCLSGDGSGALEIIYGFIDDQHFKPVALSVASPEFQIIRDQIIQQLQSKLELVKDSFQQEGIGRKEKLSGLALDEESKKMLGGLVDSLNASIAQSSDYSILLSSGFKESHSNFLSYLELLGELRSRSIGEQDALRLNKEKLDAIYQFNTNLGASVLGSKDVATVSHKLLLDKIKSHVKVGIESKMLLFKSDDLVHQSVQSVTDEQLRTLAQRFGQNPVGFIVREFVLKDWIKRVRPKPDTGISSVDLPALEGTGQVLELLKKRITSLSFLIVGLIGLMWLLFIGALGWLAYIHFQNNFDQFLLFIGQEAISYVVIVVPIQTFLTPRQKKLQAMLSLQSKLENKESSEIKIPDFKACGKEYTALIDKYHFIESINPASANQRGNRELGIKTFDFSDCDQLFYEAAKLVVFHQYCSISLLRRKLKENGQELDNPVLDLILGGYIDEARAENIINQLVAAGIVGDQEESSSGSVMWRVLIKDDIALEDVLQELGYEIGS